VVVGTPTFGKGLVQTLFTLGEDVALKLTTARWYTPSGRTIQRQAADIEDQIALAENEAQGIEDTLHAAVDTAKLPAYRTDAGRVVRGGGGIVPDIIVRRDTLTADERKFIAAIGPRIPEYRDVLTAFALDMKREGRVTSESFQVTPEMLQDVRRRLNARGVNISEADFQGADRILREQLAYEVARYVFSREAEFRRRARDDRQLQTGMDLLRRASTPKDLLQLSMAERSGSPSGH
jgi:carboxyl-terminal processing protease